MSLGRARGFTLIELLISMAIAIFLLVMAVPLYMRWIADAQTANAASTLADGLRLAQGEAIKRNRIVEFTFTSGSSWTIQEPSGSTIKAVSFPEGSKYSTMTPVPALNTTVTFSSLGTIIPNATAPVQPFTQVNVSTPGGNRDLRVLVGGGYGIRVCDPNIPVAGDPKKCP